MHLYFNLYQESVYIYLFIYLETREEERPPSCKRHGMLAGYAEL